MTVLSSPHRLLKQRRFRQILIASVILALIMGVVIVPVEHTQPNSTINNLSDGLWWSIQTLTTVGYGDVAPVTGIGRIIGVFMQIVGAVMFGIVLAMIGSSMGRSQEEFYWNRLFERIDRLEEDISNLKKNTTFMVKDATTNTNTTPPPPAGEHSNL